MTVMDFYLIGCGVGLVFCLYLLYSWWARSRRRYLLRKQISYEIDELIDQLGHVTEKLATSKDDSGDILNDARYLTTLITVMVKKNDGVICLTEEDFAKCTTSDYISVQYDATESSLYLVSNELLPMGAAVDTEDDTTYH